MDHKLIEKYRKDLMFCALGPVSKKEELLISNLEDMLSHLERGEAIPEEQLDRMRYKISRVSCFAEKYYPMYKFILENS